MSCLFCSSPGPMSKEDVVPRWALRALGIAGRVTVRRGPEDEYVTQYTGVGPKLPDICEPCNTGWMSRLESEVGPWLTPGILGEQMALAMPQQRVASYWAVKTATLYEAAMRKFRHVTPAPPNVFADLYENRESRIPPRGSQVWIGRWDPWDLDDAAEPFRMSQPYSTAISYPSPHLDSDWTEVCYLYSFTIGYLMFQVFGQAVEPSGRAPGGGPLSVLLPRTEVQPFLQKLWPDPDHVVVWPPRETVANGDFVAFASWASGLHHYVIGNGPSQRVVLADHDTRARFGAP